MKSHWTWVRSSLLAVVSLVLLVVVIGWLSGWFHAKEAPGRATDAGQRYDGPTVTVREVESPRLVRAVGTIRAVHETAVGSRLLARVQKVHVIAGQTVTAGDVLVDLDRANIEAQLSQARANISAAQARLRRADSDLEKVTDLQKQGAATEREVSDARHAADEAKANHDAAFQAHEEIKAQLDYATIVAPISGVVIDKQVEEGDLARPGETLVTLYDPSHLQLVAPVPERLAMQLTVKQRVGVMVDALNMQCEAQISEIVPEASAASRSMLVKVSGPCPPGVYSGMFGRLLIQDGVQKQLLVPTEAVRQVGQLEMVMVVGESGRASQALVRTGERVGDEVEVLSGLAAGDIVALTPAAVGME